MPRIGPKGRKWLKIFHVLFACMWVGGGIVLTIMIWWVAASDGMELYGKLAAMKLVDDAVIIPGANGMLLTGLLYSLFTRWGWFKHRWIVVKWCINLYGVLFGTFYLGPWLNALPPIAREEGMAALLNPVYAHNHRMLLFWGTFQVSTLVLALFVTVLKPWKKTGSSGRTTSAA
jgi:hypothetical protein